MKYLNVNDILGVQVGNTTKCNLMCSGCNRVDISGTKLNQNLPLEDMSLSTFKRLFTTSFTSHLSFVEFCPTDGDPVASSSLLDSLSHLSQLNSELEIIIHTNGSLRNPKYWNKLATILKLFSSHEIRFSIDGIGETNAYYRRDSNFTKIIDNASAFINAGGNAIWQFIEFQHNRHQKQLAKLKAEELGFNDIKFRKNRSRELTPEELTPKKHWELGVLPLPEKIKKKFNPNSKYQVSCEWQQRKMIYFSFRGEIWPCCYLNNRRFSPDYDDYIKFDKDILSQYPKNFNNINNHSLEDILNSKWFSQDLSDSWEQTGNSEKNCLQRKCAENCGEKS